MAKECNVVNMRKFIAALESGLYEQGMGRLRNGNRFCCLGVACEQARQAGVEMTVKKDQPVLPCGNPDCKMCGVDEGWIYDNEMGYLPLAVQEWLGIESKNPALSGCSATWWNDNEKVPFSTIAQLFRNEYLSEDNSAEEDALYASAGL